MMAGGRLIALLGAALAAAPALAVEYRSVEAPAAILYDVPSAKGKKLYIVRQYTPLEVVVRLEGMVKVRDAEGSLAWIEAKALSDKRQVVVTASSAEVRKEARADAPLAFEADKWVALELLEAAPAGWAKVRHRDGATGYVKATQVWGL